MLSLKLKHPYMHQQGDEDLTIIFPSDSTLQRQLKDKCKI